MDKKKRKDWKLSEAQKYEARAAFDALEGSGLTISDCIRIALGRDTVASKKQRSATLSMGFCGTTSKSKNEAL
jgi:hypothetical protein